MPTAFGDVVDLTHINERGQAHMVDVSTKAVTVREASAAGKQLHNAAAEAGVRRPFAPHRLRHAHSVEMAH